MAKFAVAHYYNGYLDLEIVEAPTAVDAARKVCDGYDIREAFEDIENAETDFEEADSVNALNCFLGDFDTQVAVVAIH